MSDKMYKTVKVVGVLLLAGWIGVLSWFFMSHVPKHDPENKLGQYPAFRN